MFDCPRCDSPLRDGICTRCYADLTGEVAVEVWESSIIAADAILARQAIIDRLPVAITRASPALHKPAPRVVLAARDAPAKPVTTVSQQSVLATAGAALVAIAAFVFTFLNPDLTDELVRSLVVAGVTVVFLGSAWLLMRAGLRFSAEAVGALAMVFVVLDIVSIAGPSNNVWLTAGLATLLVSAGVVALATVTGLRTWLWCGLVGLALAPAFIGYAGGSLWTAILGHVGLAAAALGLQLVMTKLEPRFSGALAIDRHTASTLQIVGVVVILAQLSVMFGLDVAQSAILGNSTILATLACLAALSARVSLAPFWNAAAGVFAATAAAILPLAWVSSEWMLALVPGAAALALAALTVARAPRATLSGAWAVTLFFTLAPAMASLPVVALPMVDTGSVLPTAVGLAGTALASALLWRLSAPRPAALAVALWVGAVSVGVFTRLPELGHLGQVTGGLVLAMGLALAARRWTSAPSVARMPLIVGAHAAVVLTAALTWLVQPTLVASSIAVIGAFAVVALSAPASVRAIHAGVGYGYALVIVGTAVGLAGEESIIALCVVSATASAVAIATTLVRRIPAPYWYAVLIVTTVPFALGVATVLYDIRDWTGLSTAVTFALALTLLLTNRPGLNTAVRTAAAAILVPSLAVVVICVGAYYVASSASPITLPIIAVIVAVVLPLTSRIRLALVSLGQMDVAAVAARDWIEISSLVTATIAVLLAIVRDAAGLPTALTVLVIVGLGAVAAAHFGGRRYFWLVAAVSFTGALWTTLLIADVAVPEAYVLPPALGVALVGAIGVARGLPAAWLYRSGLIVAAGSSLAVYVVGEHSQVRLIALVASAAALLLLIRVAPPWFASLTRTTLFVAVALAGAVVIEAINVGSGEVAQSPIVAALGLSALAALIAAVAGRMLATSTPSRWVYAPALVYLVVGPIAAVRVDLFTMWTLWGLSMAILAFMVFSVRRPGSLPPVWFTFALALAVAIAGWSTREWLRVEAFSVPLGVALLIAGALVMRRPREVVPTLTSWPVGFTGSWNLLVPGLFVTLGPSMLATSTDPQTWRAVLVIALALAAILVGSLRRLAAPFILGIIVLPIENLLVFSVQIGRNISSTPWWITLATAGAALLVIAVTYERRGSGAGLRELS